MKTDHVTFIAASAEFRCERCGAFLLLVDEIDIATCITQLRGFALTHSVCKPRPEPTRQTALPNAAAIMGQAQAQAQPCVEDVLAGIDSSADEPAPLTSPAQRGKCGLCGRFGQLQFYELGLMMVCLGGCPEEGIDGSTDEPAEEIDPPGPDVFAKLYPMARDHSTLRDHLHAVLTPEQYAKLPHGTVEAWHPATGIFDAIAHWARIEKAHTEIPKREPIAGFYLQGRMPMPVKLAELLGETAKPKRARKAHKPRAAEPLNACGPNDTSSTSI